MRRVAVKLLWAVLAGAALVVWIWGLKGLIAGASPDFAAGLVGGVIWTVIFSKAWQLFRWTLEDVTEECTRQYPRNEQSEK